MSSSAPPPSELNGIGQIAINVHDLDRAVAFYRGALRLPLAFQVPGMAFFHCGGVRLMLGVPEKPEFDHPSSIVYFTVDDAEAAHVALSARGVTFLAPPHVIHRSAMMELWMAFFRDTEGNTLALMCEKRLAGQPSS
jgi:methylmalonyl-CoA/ethylmalonyl-CoA epimerase